MFGGAWRVSFPMVFSTQSSKTTFWFWQSCIAIVSLVTGEAASSWNRQL
jgi:hypothetical protein